MVAAQIHDADDRPEPRQHVGYRHLRTETVRWMKCARSNRKEEQMRNAGVHERCLQPDSIQEFYPVSLSEKSTVWAKHFPTNHPSTVDVAHGLALLFGRGTKALPSWGFEEEVEQSFGRP